MTSENTVPSESTNRRHSQSLAVSTIQYDLVAMLKSSLEASYAARPDAVVAANLIVRPDRDRDDVNMVPSVLVAFGRPKGDRECYDVWNEGEIFPQVVIELRSPADTDAILEIKRQLYGWYGANEFYSIRPEYPARISCWRREGRRLKLLPPADSYVSFMLRYKFEVRDGDLVVYAPDGRMLQTPAEVISDRDKFIRHAEKDRQSISLLKKRLELADTLNEHVEFQRQMDAEYVKELESRRLRFEAALWAAGIDPDAV